MSPSDPRERIRLRDALGFDPPERSAAGPARRAVTDAEHAAVAVRELEHKIDALIGNVATIDQLSATVRDLSGHVIDLERRLIGLQ